MNTKTLFSVIPLLWLFSACTPRCNQTAIKEAITGKMNDQLFAWNGGDIPTFMEAYWNNDSLQFIGSKGIQYGYQTTLNNYLKSYDTADKMGKLSFKINDLEPIGCADAVVKGQWAIESSNGTPSGYFTLHWKLIDGTWLIVYDHTS